MPARTFKILWLICSTSAKKRIYNKFGKNGEQSAKTYTCRADKSDIDRQVQHHTFLPQPVQRLGCLHQASVTLIDYNCSQLVLEYPLPHIWTSLATFQAAKIHTCLINVAFNMRNQKYGKFAREGIIPRHQPKPNYTIRLFVAQIPVCQLEIITKRLLINFSFS